MTTEPIAAPLAYEQKGPRFVAKQMAAAVHAAGPPLSAAQARVAFYAKEHLVHVRETGARTSPNKFEFSDMAAAIVLSAFQDVGIQDRNFLRIVSDCLYRWSPLAKAKIRDEKYRVPGSPYLPRHPIDRAVIGIGFRKEVWCFHADIWRDSQTDEKTISCDLLQFGDASIGHVTVPVTALPVATVVIPLQSMLLPVAKQLTPVAGTDA